MPARSCVVIGTDDLAAFDDRRRFPAHLALGGGLDPTWLDLFSEAARTVTGADGPADFIDARLELEAPGPTATTARSSASTRPGSRAVARISDGDRRRDRRALDRPGRGGARRAAARGEALDPRPRRAHRGLLPRGRPRARTSCSPGRFGEPTRRRDHAASFAANAALWDAWTAHPRRAATSTTSTAFRAGGVRIRPYEIELIGDVAGKSLLHLQCHFGIDTLSWARLGARVTGADLSPAAIELARALADELGFPDARFVQSNLYDLPDALDGHVRHRLHVARRPRLAARHPGLGAGRRPLPGARRHVLHHRGPPGRPGLRERGRRARRAAPGLPVLGARRAADLRGQGLVRRPGRRCRRPDRARLGPRPGRDRDRADRRRAADRDARRAPVPRLEGRLPRRADGDDHWVLPPGTPGELPLMFSLLATKPA